MRRWSKGGGGGGDYVWSIPWFPSLCPVCGRPRGTAGGGAQAWAGRVGSGARPRRRRRHVGAGPVAVAGRCGRTGRRPAVALRAPLHGVGGRAGGGGGGGGLAGGCAREGDGVAVSSAVERQRAANRAEQRPGLAKVSQEPGALEVSGGRGQRWGPQPARRGRIPLSIIHGGES